MRKIWTSATRIRIKAELHNSVPGTLQKSNSIVFRQIKYRMSTATYGNTKLEKLSKYNDGQDKESAEIDTPPVLYIAKYNRLIDTGDLTIHTGDNIGLPNSQSALPSKVQDRVDEEDIDKSEQDWTENLTLANSKNDIILRAVTETKSFEELSKVLIEQPDHIFKKELAVRTKSLGKHRFAESEEDWKEDQIEPRKLLTYYLMLSKSRLTALVAITSVAGYSMAPNIIFDPIILLTGTVGVALFSASANTLNQLLEVPYDSQMNRTKNRVLVKCRVSPLHAMSFAICTAVTGGFLLGAFVNSTALYLGIANLLLYVCVYTPLKRITIANTWVGSIVGALPPLIGYASATGGTLDCGAGILAAILFSWQFPHFNSLSWNLRPDYSKAGYRMMSVTNPDLCKRVALRHSIALIAISSIAAPLLDVTTLTFAVISLPVNGVLTYLAFKFYQKSDSASSRQLFRYTLIHLPLLLTLLYISKKEKSEKLENLASEDITKEYILSDGMK